MMMPMLIFQVKSKPNPKCADYPRVTVGPENPIRVERDETAELYCEVPQIMLYMSQYISHYIKAKYM